MFQQGDRIVGTIIAQAFARLLTEPGISACAVETAFRGESVDDASAEEAVE